MGMLASSPSCTAIAAACALLALSSSCVGRATVRKPGIFPVDFGYCFAPFGKGIASKKSSGIFVGCPFSRLPRGFVSVSVSCSVCLALAPRVAVPWLQRAHEAHGAAAFVQCCFLPSLVAKRMTGASFYITRDLCDANMAAYGDATDWARIRACA